MMEPEFPESVERKGLKTDNLAQLPGLAQVALGARIGRYSQPLIRKYWLDKDDDALSTLDKAIDCYEKSLQRDANNGNAERMIARIREASGSEE